MFGPDFRDFVSQEQSQSSKILKKSDSGDSGAEEGFEILGQEEIKEHRHSEDSGNCSEAEGEFEVLDGKSQEIPATPCSTLPEDLSLESAILANFPDGCDRSLTVELKDEVSFDIISKSLTFAEITNILNQAIQEDNCEELDKVVQNIEDYEGRSITLDNVNLKSFCEQQLNLDLQDRSDHQHIYSNVLSQYKFDQEEFKYDYSVKELVLLAIAANDKLTERYQDILFIEENLSLLPLLVGGQEYVKAFIGRFHDTDGIYGRLKDQTIQLVEPNKIDFFSVIALRKEQESLNAVFVEYVLRDFGQVLKTSNPDSLYGVLETASLIKNKEFITIVLDAFERYINELTKKASTEELLKKSFATLLETAISQEHISVVEYLCKRYTNSTDHAIYDVYEQAFADDKVITILRQQILKNIGARGRKEIYDLILKTALDAGNIAFIEHLCKECAECSNDVINYLDHKSKNNEFDEIYESILVALSNTGSQNIIASVLAHVQIYQSIPNNKQQVVRQTIQNILRNAIKEANYEVVVLLCQHVDLKFAALQAIYKEEFEKALPVVAEQLEKISMELSPSMTRNEYQKNRDTLDNLYLIRSLLESSKLINTSSKANIQTQADTQVNKGSSNNAASPIVNVEDTSAMIGETATSSQAVDGKNNSQLSSQKSKSTDSQQPQENVDRRENIMSNEEASIEEAIGNNYRRGKMSKNKKSIKQGLFIDVIYDVKRMKNFLESNDDKLVLKKALNQVNTELTKKENTRGLDLAKKNIRINQKKRLTEAKELLTEKISNIEMNAKTAASSVNDVSATTSSQAAPVSEDVSQDIRSEILVPSSSVSPDVGNVSTAENINDNMVASENSGQVNDVQTTTKQLEEPISPSVPPTVHVSQNNIHVQPSNSTPTVTATRSSTPTTQVVPKNVPAASVPPVTSKSSGQADNVQINSKQSTNPSNIANVSSDVNNKPITKEPVATESNQQNSLPPLSSFDLSSPQRFVDDKVSSITGVLRSEVSIEDNTSSLDITDDEYSEDSSVVSEDSLIEDVTDEKEPLLDKTNKGDSTLKSSNSPQSTKSSKLPVIAASALAIAGIISGVAVAVYLEMLAVGIAVGACCLVAAVIIYCCNRPSSSFKGSNVELIADEELAAQQTVN